MKTIVKSLMTAGLLLATTAASAQKVMVQDLETWMGSLISKAIDNKVEVTKSLGQERDILQEGTPLKWRCDIMTFTLPKKQRPLLDEMIKAFEVNGRENRNCYGINTLTMGNPQREGKRNLMIGEDMNRYVTIGEQYGNYINVNILDTADTTKTHRYAYALEWKEDHKGKVFARYIVTYAKIPSATSSIIRQDWPYLEIGPSRIPKEGPVQAPNKARVFFLGKEYPVQALDSVLDEARKREAETYKKVKEAIQREAEGAKHMKSFVVWADSLHHDTDPVTAVVLDLQQGKNITADDLLCNDNILLIFAQLKKQYLAGQNTEFNAISIYNLCKRAHEYGFFTDKNSKEELKQLKREIADLIDKTPEIDEGTNVDQRIYLGLALSHLKKIE
ncbi:MAG: hypothetical protein J6W75_02560 [Bacteroidaceae bacterium]|nr:hypothetical protein [Bacteroidaceae bacterium]